MAESTKTRKTASFIRQQIERGGERLWRHDDFRRILRLQHRADDAGCGQLYQADAGES